MYINCHSYYSLRYGTLSVEKLVERAAELGIQALALTDINNSTGIMDFIAVCGEYGIKPIAGIEFRNEDSSAIEAVQVCIDTSCADYQMECGAGAVCSVQVEIDYGCVDITVATIRSGLMSAHTPPRSICSIGELERYDRNGDGKVTTIDFGPFMEAFHAP